MPERVWYRSLYWRIGLGFVSLLATLLLVQGAIFLWISGRMSDFFPTRSPAQLAASIAGDLSAALTDRPDTDIGPFVKQRFASTWRGFVVVMADGRTTVSDRVAPPPSMLRAARGRLFSELVANGRASEFVRGGGPGPSGPSSAGGRGFRPAERGGDRSERGTNSAAGPNSDRLGDHQREWAGDAGGPGGPPADRGPRGDFMRGRGDFDRFGPGAGGMEYAWVIVNGSLTGMVGVPREAPPISATLRDLGPTLASVALGLLIAGTSIAALVIFRPTRRRLLHLEDAAKALGAGRAGVRAPVEGGDEVTALSVAFNDMAGQLEQRTQALEAADRTRRQLLADISHELATPLAAIRGYVETLQMTDLKLDESRRERYLSIVSDESERLEHIIGDLLDLARLEGGGGTFRWERVRLEHLLERVQHRHDRTVNDRQITLAVRQETGAEVVDGDQNRLEQALQNLVANAIRHTPNGGAVTVTAAPAADRIALIVEDTGPGVPPEHLPRIFDRFYKVDESRTGTAMPSGSGLGLSIVQAIVARHGGSVQASNRPQGGARFEILLPRERPA